MYMVHDRYLNTGCSQKARFGQELCPLIDMKKNYLVSTNNLNTNDWIS